MTFDPAAVSARAPRPPLARPRVCVLSGVSVAVADHVGWTPATVRWIFAGTTLLSGAGVLLYLWLWAFTPLRPAPVDDPEQRVSRRVNVPWMFAVSGAVTALVAIVVVGGGLGVGVAFVAATVLLLSVAAGWDQLVDDTSTWPSPLSATAFRMSVGALLVGLALVLSVVQAGRATASLWLAIIATTLAGLAVLVAPLALRLWRELIAERTARVRQEQRAEMAAHLHDSVLQTLALIQNRAGASSEVGRIARAQERELREWLFAESAHAPDEEAGDLATELREAAALLEVDHAVHIDIVVVGDPVRHSPPELAAAAREAMLNAARHAGGEVSVYIEAGRGAVDVFVRDRGPGFDVDELPEGRLGVRESILGRMRRAGGAATVMARPTGTEVHLNIELPSASE